MSFKKATKQQAKGRLALIGPPGSGKTYTALTFAQYLGKKVGVIDTEHGSASKYADIFDFDVVELTTFSPQNYVDKIHEAEAAGYDVIIIDSLSHAWTGKNGALEMVDQVAARTKSRNTFNAWREVTPHHNAMVEAILGARCHIIATLRSKVEYVVEEDNRGRKVPRKVGMAPVQRDGLEYEFDVVGDMDPENTLVVTKSRCPKLSGVVVNKPGREFSETFNRWLSNGHAIDEMAAASNLPESLSYEKAKEKTIKEHFWAIFQDRYAKCNNGQRLPANTDPAVISETVATLCETGPVAEMANHLGHTPLWSRDGSARMLPDDPAWETLILAIQKMDVKKFFDQANENLHKG